MKRFIKVFFLTSIFFTSCSNNSNQSTDTATTGKVNITIDESLQKLFKAQVYTFESHYSKAKINSSYLPESDALFRLINDSCKVVVLCRDLTMAERKTLESNNLFPVSTKIAEDAIAVIANIEDTTTILTVEQIKSILSGTYSKKVNAVFDNKGSVNATYMRDSLLHGKEFAANVFALTSSPEVINYVSQNKNTIGFLSVNWISDLDDIDTQNSLKKIKVIAVSKNDTSPSYKPFQAYIKTKEYPFSRSVFMINRQTRVGLGTGFVNFVAGEKGQLIILKSGLVPAFPPQRIIQINNK